MTARALAREIARELNDAGIDDAAFEAELLTRRAAGITRAQFLADTGVEADAAGLARTMAARRLQREPSAYITGTREFYGRAFDVTAAVLIPRPETELLVDLTLTELRSAPGSLVADIGTGSGCVAISVAVERPDDGLTVAVDRSADALRVARHNAEQLGGSVAFVRGDLGAPLGRADVLVANLPYIPTAEIASLQPEVREWEPRLALDGGGDGLDAVRRLVSDCGRRLRPRFLALEVGSGQAREVRALCARAGAAETAVHLDLASIERAVTARWE